VIVDFQSIFIPAGKGVAHRGIDQRRGHTGDSFQFSCTLVESWQGLHQSPGVRMPGIIVHFLGGANLHDLACVHNGHSVSAPCHHTQIVGNKDCCRAQLGLNLFQKIQNLRLDGHIQGSGRFVGQQNLRVSCQSDSHDTSLPHTAGEIVGIQLIPLVRLLDAHQLHQLDDPVIDFLFRQLRLMN